MRHLTRIVGVPLGVNILGLLELFAWIGSMVGIGSLSGIVHPAVGICGMVGGFIGIAAFDIWWRARQPEQSLWKRLYSPFTGGCFAFLPVWSLLLALFITGVIFLIIKLA